MPVDLSVVVPSVNGLGDLIGCLTALQAQSSDVSLEMLVVDRLDPAGKPAGGYLIAVAAIDAGVGERVLVLDEGTGARQILGNSKAPIRSVVVGVVDSVDVV